MVVEREKQRLIQLADQLNNRVSCVKQKAELAKNNQCNKEAINALITEIANYVHLVATSAELKDCFRNLVLFRRNVRRSQPYQEKLEQAARCISDIGKRLRSLPDFDKSADAVDFRIGAWFDPFKYNLGQNSPLSKTAEFIGEMEAANIDAIHDWGYYEAKRLLSAVSGDANGLNGIIPYWPEIDSDNYGYLLNDIGNLSEIIAKLEQMERFDAEFLGVDSAIKLHQIYAATTPEPADGVNLTFEDRMIAAMQLNIIRTANSAQIDNLLLDCRKVNEYLNSKLAELMTSEEPLRRILFIAAIPRDASAVRPDVEFREVSEALRNSANAELFDLQTRIAARAIDLSRALLKQTPEILHFSGHGCASGIVVEDDYGNAQLVSTDALKGLLSLFAGSIKCVFLNSCYSEAQAMAISQAVPYVIAMNSSVYDKTAIHFSTEFYSALFAGKDIEFAFQYAVAAIGVFNLPGTDIPVIYKNGSKVI